MRPFGIVSGSRAIAVAEDDLEMRKLLVHALHKDGHQVHEYCSGDALLDGLAGPFESELVPALIITDVCMPGRSGLSLLRELRLRAYDVPIVVITAFATEGTLNEACGLGASVVLRKPFAMDDLRRVAACFVPPATQWTR